MYKMSFSITQPVKPKKKQISVGHIRAVLYRIIHDPPMNFLPMVRIYHPTILMM